MSNFDQIVRETKNYHIIRDKKAKANIFVGSMGSCDDDLLTHAFIPATDEQLKNFGELQQLASSHARILYVQRRYDGNDMPLLIVEKVDPVDSIFERLMKSSMDLDKRKWWNLIEDVFKRTFRDIIETLQYLYVEGKACGNLSFGLFVTSHNRAKVLPSMDTNVSTRMDDLKQLVNKMKVIIGMPFRTTDVLNDPEFDLPPALTHFLSRYDCTDPELVPWILKSPFFWTIAEEKKFLEGVSMLLDTLPGLWFDVELGLDNLSVYSGSSWPLVLAVIKLFGRKGIHKYNIVEMFLLVAFV